MTKSALRKIGTNDEAEIGLRSWNIRRRGDETAFLAGRKGLLRPLYFGELSKIIKSGIVFGALIPQRAVEIVGVVPEHPQGDHGG